MSVIHLIGNAHLDPVWLWDLREGLNEGLTTVRTILDLMDENPEMTFIRGEVAIYEHIEKYDPQSFERILRQFHDGRWDVVGGTYIQPDSNLPSVETLARHFTRGQRYFKERIGRPVRVAWQADSFGHTKGWPEVLAAAGIESFAFTRPAQREFPLPESAFWWEGESGARILCFRPIHMGYCSERDAMKGQLDHAYNQANKEGRTNFGCFYGLGNHGGGPSRRHLAEIQEWRKDHPEVVVKHSGLHKFFDELRAEVVKPGSAELPVVKGEINFCLRGCYSSVARFKFPYRRAENLLSRAETTIALAPAAPEDLAQNLKPAWDDLLLNSFHDILPGSSIERAMDEQITAVNAVAHASVRAEFSSLNRLAAAIDTRVKPVTGDHPTGVAILVWNPNQYAYAGLVEIEAALDSRPVWKYSGRSSEVPIQILGPDRQPLPFQKIATEHSSMPDWPFRCRALVPVKIPAYGWNILEMAWVEGAEKPEPERGVRAEANAIDNGIYRVEACVGEEGVQVFFKERPVFAKGEGLRAALFEDPWGSWGGMNEEPDSLYLNKVIETWKITNIELLESGPERATLWVRLAGARSHLDWSISLSRDRAVVDFRARLLFNEQSCRLKLSMPVGDEVEFSVPGGSVIRKPCGEVPGGRWAHVHHPSGGFGFASDALYNFSASDGRLFATVARATRYANDVNTPADTEPWRPAVDAGELKFNFLLTPDRDALPALALQLERPLTTMMVLPSPGNLPRNGALASISPESLDVLAIKRAENGDGLIIRVQGTAPEEVTATFRVPTMECVLGEVGPGAIRSWRLRQVDGKWEATPVNLAEE